MWVLTVLIPCLLVLTSLSDGTNPGLKLRLTQNGLNYGMFDPYNNYDLFNINLIFVIDIVIVVIVAPLGL